MTDWEEWREDVREHAQLQDDDAALDRILAARLEYGYVHGRYTDGARWYDRTELEARAVPLSQIHTGVEYVSERAARDHWGDPDAATLSKPRHVLERLDGTIWALESPELVAWLAIVAPDAMLPCMIVGRETARPFVTPRREEAQP